MQAGDSTGLTAGQRFFYRSAHRSRAAQTDADLRQAVAADDHAPPAFRVNGPLSNLPAFGSAFQCRPQARMARDEDRCVVW